MTAPPVSFAALIISNAVSCISYLSLRAPLSGVIVGFSGIVVGRMGRAEGKWRSQWRDLSVSRPSGADRISFIGIGFSFRLILYAKMRSSQAFVYITTVVLILLKPIRVGCG